MQPSAISRQPSATLGARRQRELSPAITMNALRRIVRALRQADASSRNAGGLPSAQLFVLRQLRDKDAMSIRDLCDATLTSQSSVSEVVGRLESNGLISHSKAADDNRRAKVSLTEKGRRSLDGAETPFQERLVASLRRMSRKDQEALARGMSAWLAEAGIGDSPAKMFFEP